MFGYSFPPTEPAAHLRRMSGIALLLGLAGVLPFLACGLMTLATLDPASSRWAAALVGYGAVVLGFIGAVQWGLAMADPQARAERTRLVFAVVPAVIGWLALLVDAFGPSELAIALLIGGYVVTIGGEDRAARAGLLPGGYLAMRWLLTLIAVAVLTTVLMLRLIGAHVIYL